MHNIWFGNIHKLNPAKFVLSVAHNHVWERFDIRYGVYGGAHLAKRYYRRYMQAYSTILQERYANLGFVASAHFRIANALYA